MATLALKASVNFLLLFFIIIRVKINHYFQLNPWSEFWGVLYKIVYQNGILTPKQFDKSKNISEIEQEQINDSTLVISIPKYSTVRIARTSNTYFVNKINSISYNDNELSIDEVLKNSKSKNWKIIYIID
jgi:hypothetical protein